jgi:hypothetical protein
MKYMHASSTEIIIAVISSCFESAHFFEGSWLLAVVLTENILVACENHLSPNKRYYIKLQ